MSVGIIKSYYHCVLIDNSDSSWFAYISPTEPCLLEDVLVTPKHSLAKQVSEHYLPKVCNAHVSESVFVMYVERPLIPSALTT